MKLAAAKNSSQVIDKGKYRGYLQRVRNGLKIPNADKLGFYDFSDLSHLTHPDIPKDTKNFKPWVMVNGRKIKLTKDP